jgi:hypothetical protein
MKKLLYLLTGITLLLILAGVGTYWVRYLDHYFNEKKIVSTDEAITIIKVDEKLMRLYNYVSGYAINYPAQWRLDVSDPALKSDLSDDRHEIEVYSDDFTGKISDAKSYIGYSNGFLARDQEIRVERNEYTILNGRLANLTKWQRDKLARIDNDKNYYLCVKLVENSHQVYTILMKSSQPIDEQAFIKLVKASVSLKKNLSQPRRPATATRKTGIRKPK